MNRFNNYEKSQDSFITDVEAIKILSRIDYEWSMKIKDVDVLANEMQEILNMNIKKTNPEYSSSILKLRNHCNVILNNYSCCRKHKLRLIALSEILYELY